MSHFTVMVVGDDFKKQLQPYHEYECTGVEDEYVSFVPTDESQEEIDSAYKENGKKYTSKSNFMEEYYGYEFDEKTKKWGNLTNPNSKWDWFQVGGRWSGELVIKPVSLLKDQNVNMNELGFSDNEMFELLKKFEHDKDAFNRIAAKYKGKTKLITEIMERWEKGRYPKDAKLGEKSFMNENTVVPSNRADIAKKCDIDIEGMEKPMRERASSTWSQWHNEIKFLRDDDKKQTNWINENIGYFRTAEAMERLTNMTKKEYVACNSVWYPYALVYEGKWYEKGEMLMFGMSVNEESDWGSQFKELWKEIPEDSLITMVDAHI